MATAHSLTGVSAVAICVTEDFHEARICFGSSDRNGLWAEQLEFTLGAGPGFTAQRIGRVVQASGPAFRTEWPLLSDAWEATAQFRAVQVVPAGDPAMPLMVQIMLWYPSAVEMYAATTVEVDAVIDEVWRALEPTLAELAETGVARLSRPNSGASESVRRRLSVEPAAGLVASRMHVDPQTGRDLLRAHAWARDRTLDDVAFHDASGRIRLDLG